MRHSKRQFQKVRAGFAQNDVINGADEAQSFGKLFGLLLDYITQ